MASGTRTGKQTAVFVISIISIIGAIFLILLGIASFLGGGYLLSGGAGESVPLDVNGETMELTGESVGVLAGFAGIILVLSGIFELLMGIFGIRGSRDASKIGPFFVLAVISTIFAVISLISSFGLSNVVSVVINAVCVWLGYSIKKEAAYR